MGGTRAPRFAAVAVAAALGVVVLLLLAPPHHTAASPTGSCLVQPDANGHVSATGYASLPARAFSACAALKTIDLAGDCSIGDNAFDGAVNLEVVTFAAHPAHPAHTGTALGGGVPGRAAPPPAPRAPPRPCSIGDYAFRGCGSLAGIVLPASLISIGDGAFDGCGRVASVVIPAAVRSIGASVRGRAWRVVWGARRGSDGQLAHGFLACRVSRAHLRGHGRRAFGGGVRVSGLLSRRGC